MNPKSEEKMRINRDCILMQVDIDRFNSGTGTPNRVVLEENIPGPRDRKTDQISDWVYRSVAAAEGMDQGKRWARDTIYQDFFGKTKGAKILGKVKQVSANPKKNMVELPNSCACIILL